MFFGADIVGAMEDEKLSRRIAVGVARRDLASLMFETLHNLLYNGQSNFLEQIELDDCHELTKCNVKQATILWYFRRSPL